MSIVRAPCQWGVSKDTDVHTDVQRLLRWEQCPWKQPVVRPQDNFLLQSGNPELMGVWTLETDCHQDVGSRGKVTRGRRACSVSPGLTGTLEISLN